MLYFVSYQSFRASVSYVGLYVALLTEYLYIYILRKIPGIFRDISRKIHDIFPGDFRTFSFRLTASTTSESGMKNSGNMPIRQPTMTPNADPTSPAMRVV